MLSLVLAVALGASGGTATHLKTQRTQENASLRELDRIQAQIDSTMDLETVKRLNREFNLIFPITQPQKENDGPTRRNRR